MGRLNNCTVAHKRLPHCFLDLDLILLSGRGFPLRAVVGAARGYSSPAI